MIWLAMGAVIVGVTAVLIYVFVIRWRRMARYGRLDIPCDEVVSLPAGEVVVFYEDGFRWRYSDRPRPWGGFSVLISDADSGERIDLGDASSETGMQRSGKNRIPYAAVRLRHAGRYRVVVQVNEDATDPAIMFG